jgi:hypothetical protein
MEDRMPNVSSSLLVAAGCLSLASAASVARADDLIKMQDNSAGQYTALGGGLAVFALP